MLLDHQFYAIKILILLGEKKKPTNIILWNCKAGLPSHETLEPEPRGLKQACACSVVSDSVTPGTLAHQAPLSMGFSRQEYWRGLSFPPPGDLPDLGIEPTPPESPALAGEVFTTAPGTDA